MATKKKLPAKKTTKKSRGVAKSRPGVGAESVTSVPDIQVMSAVLVTSPEVLEPVVVSDISLSLDLESTIYQRPNQLWIIALLIGWAFDYLFWKRPVGLNFAVFTTVCILGGAFLLYLQGLRPSRRSLWLLAPFMFFAVITFLRAEPLTIFLAYTFMLLAAGMFATTYVGGRWYLYGLSDYIYRFFLLLGDMFAAPIKFLFKARKVQMNLGEVKRGFSIGALARGLVIALPIVVCFASLLAAGDLVFKEKLAKNFGMDKMSEDLLRGILILFCAYFVSGIFLHAVLKSQDKILIAETKPKIRPFLGFTESAVILRSVSILFLAFVIVQFQYFFGGENNICV